MKTMPCHKVLLSLVLFMLVYSAFSQGGLKPGFDPDEYADLLGLTYEIPEINGDDNLRVPVPKHYRHVYQSPTGPLDNRWDMYLEKENIAVIEVRGTTSKTRSWLENFYAGMVPATGTLQIGTNEKFNYKLASDPEATVHAGWLTGLATIAPDIIEKINEYYAKGIHEFILMGHSQGAGIVYLLNSYLYYDLDGLIPDDITFKTYNSGAPKPGNLFYAYDYDYINRGGWAIRVVSTIDWVPQTPISVQRLDDFSEVNPFTDMETFTASMGWIERVVIKSVFRKTDRSLRKAQNRLLKFLGFKIFVFIEDYMEGMVEPEYAENMNYTPAGTPVILPPTERYYNEYVPTARDDVFKHHVGKAYYFLLKEHYQLKHQ